MESEGSLPRLQQPATCPYPEPDQSSPCPPSHFLKTHISIIFPSMLGSSKWSLSIRFPHQTPVCTSPLPIRATYPVHLILLDLITRIIFGEEDTSVRSSLPTSTTIQHTGKGKVKCTLVQALRLCTSRTAHRGSRGIALPFHDHGTRRGWGVSVTPWPLFTPGKDAVPIVQKAGWA